MLANLSELVVVCLMLGVFGSALAHKVRQRQRFSASLSAYRLLPDNSAPAVTGGLIVLEGLTLVLLLVDSATGLIMCASLLAVYLTAIAINMFRGRSYIDCGCGDEPVQLSYWLLLRNGVLLILAVATAGFSEPVNWSWVLLLSAAGLGLIAVATYYAVETLLANRSKYHRLWLDN